MEASYAKFRRAYRTVLEMVLDRGYRLPTDDIDALVEQVTFSRYQALR